MKKMGLAAIFAALFACSAESAIVDSGSWYVRYQAHGGSFDQDITEHVHGGSIPLSSIVISADVEVYSTILADSATGSAGFQLYNALTSGLIYFSKPISFTDSSCSPFGPCEAHAAVHFSETITDASILAAFDNAFSVVADITPSTGFAERSVAGQTMLITSGTVSFVHGAVPEPASWAMLVGGFGLLGSALRSRRAARVRFA